MTVKPDDWKHYLSAYGSDLSKWPVEVVQHIDSQALQKTEAFKEAQELDSLLLQTPAVQPSERFKTSALEHIFNQEQEMSWNVVMMPSSFKQSVLAMSMLIICLLGGIQFSNKVYAPSSNASASMMWLGPTAMLNPENSNDEAKL